MAAAVRSNIPDDRLISIHNRIGQAIAPVRNRATRPLKEFNDAPEPCLPRFDPFILEKFPARSTTGYRLENLSEEWNALAEGKKYPELFHAARNLFENKEYIREILHSSDLFQFFNLIDCALIYDYAQDQAGCLSASRDGENGGLSSLIAACRHEQLDSRAQLLTAFRISDLRTSCMATSAGPIAVQFLLTLCVYEGAVPPEVVEGGRDALALLTDYFLRIGHENHLTLWEKKLSRTLIDHPTLHPLAIEAELSLIKRMPAKTNCSELNKRLEAVEKKFTLTTPQAILASFIAVRAQKTSESSISLDVDQDFESAWNMIADQHEAEFEIFQTIGFDYTDYCIHTKKFANALEILTALESAIPEDDEIALYQKCLRRILVVKKYLGSDDIFPTFTTLLSHIAKNQGQRSPEYINTSAEFILSKEDLESAPEILKQLRSHLASLGTFAKAGDAESYHILEEILYRAIDAAQLEVSEEITNILAVAASRQKFDALPKLVRAHLLRIDVLLDRGKSAEDEARDAHALLEQLECEHHMPPLDPEFQLLRESVKTRLIATRSIEKGLPALRQFIDLILEEEADLSNLVYIRVVKDALDLIDRFAKDRIDHDGDEDELLAFAVALQNHIEQVSFSSKFCPSQDLMRSLADSYELLGARQNADAVYEKYTLEPAARQDDDERERWKGEQDDTGDDEDGPGGVVKSTP